jgi:hypothetical protein
MIFLNPHHADAKPAAAAFAQRRSAKSIDFIAEHHCEWFIGLPRDVLFRVSLHSFAELIEFIGYAVLFDVDS